MLLKAGQAGTLTFSGYMLSLSELQQWGGPRERDCERQARGWEQKREEKKSESGGEQIK